MEKRDLKIIFIATVLFTSIFLFSLNKVQDKSEDLLIKDVANIYPSYVKEIVKGNQTQFLVEAIIDAKREELKVSIAGKQHSQGGHSYYEDAIFLDMKDYNKVLNLDVKNKIITVQSGATWEDIQDYINPYNLSIKVMQSSNIFTIGGSLSSNIHGRDPNYGPIIETVKSFRLLLENGTIINVSREDNNYLFREVIGGYGLFGVILDVDLELTDNLVYEKETKLLDYSEYSDFFENNVRNNKEIGLHFARLSIVPDETFLRETYATNYKVISPYPENIFELQEEQNVARDKFLFGLSRKYDWGKKLRWYLQKKLEDNPEKIEVISRNNAMRPPITFLEYYSSSNTDILQEYFIPIENFASFIDSLRKIIRDEDINLLSVTIRHVPENKEAFLSYSKNDRFAVVLYINQGLSEKEKNKAEKWTQKIIDLAIENKGAYYLTYQLYPTQEQIRTVYPEIDNFFSEKKKYDPEEMFMNKFYAKYALGEEDED
jgi:FAD/FMN-containing dehydrogenase